MTPARGHTQSNQPMHKRIVVSFAAEDFDEIRERALKEGTSFAEQVRLLVTWGLEADAGAQG